jgi:hypothetical protein
VSRRQVRSCLLWGLSMQRDSLAMQWKQKLMLVLAEQVATS